MTDWINAAAKEISDWEQQTYGKPGHSYPSQNAESRHVADIIRQHAPQWRDRPTCAGWWMAAIYQVPHWPDTPTKFETWRVGNPDKFSAPELFKQEGWKYQWFGPIPEPPKEQK